MNDIQVTIIGGGFTGVNCAYQLAKAGIESIILEAGKIGKGSDEFPSGTDSLRMPRHSKMLTTPFDKGYVQFSELKEKEGAKLFQDLVHNGLDIVKTTANELCPEILHNNGTIVLGNGKQWRDILLERKYYQEIGLNYEIIQKKDINDLFDASPHAFQEGIYFPENAIIDHMKYIKLAIKKPLIQYFSDTKVVGLTDNGKNVTVSTDKGEEIKSENVVVATNSYTLDERMKSLIEPIWTFQLAFKNDGPDTPNAFTFTSDYHYFTRQDNYLMIGSGDKAAVKKQGRYVIDERSHMEKIKKWAYTKFPSLKGEETSYEHYGIFGKTKDCLPIFGKFAKNEKIAYISGCNGIGTTLLTPGCEMMPGILGYASLTNQQEKFLEFTSPNRKSLTK